jgi:hypothetical protein
MGYTDDVKSEFKRQPLHTIMMVAIVVILLVILFHRLSNKGSERFAPSYSAGADQRFQQVNTDPTLGKQFGPYNDEILAKQALLGNERLSSSREAPVVYNYGREDRDFQSPRLGTPGVPRAMRDAEAGLASTETNAEGTPQDNDVEDLINELYG